MAELRASRREPAAVAALVVAARDDDESAWNGLVDEFGGLVWSVARAHRLSPADAADVSQTTWLRLAEHLGRIRDPERVGGWLAAPARNECLRLLRRSQRELPLGDDLPEPVEPSPSLSERLVGRERADALWASFEELSDRCRTLLRILMADPPPAYEDVSEALEMPVGSIGPTRARCLENLKRLVARRGLTDASGDSWETEPL
jgi:RNA polymerase sigma factor (sigma-70 family)